MKIQREITVNKSVEEVWEVLGNQYTEAYQWASGLYHSEGFGKPTLEGATCSSRACNTSFGQLKEEIRVFDEKEYKLSYEVVEGFPSFIAKGVNNWSLTSLGENQTKVTMMFEGQTTGIKGAIMGTMMRMKLGGSLKNAIEEFKYYVENNRPHPRKVKDTQKNTQKMRLQEVQ